LCLFSAEICRKGNTCSVRSVFLKRRLLQFSWRFVSQDLITCIYMSDMQQSIRNSLYS
jgi:hypothetical protein